MSSWLWSVSVLKLTETFPRMYQRQLLPTSTVKVCLLLRGRGAGAAGTGYLGMLCVYRNAVSCPYQLHGALVSQRCRQSSRLPAGNKHCTAPFSSIQHRHKQILHLVPRVAPCQTYWLERISLTARFLMNRAVLTVRECWCWEKELHPTSEQWTLRKGEKICLLQSSYPLNQNS